jgi:hypothetical protein
VEPEKTAVARQRFSKHVSAATTPPVNIKKKLAGYTDTQAAAVVVAAAAAVVVVTFISVFKMRKIC